MANMTHVCIGIQARSTSERFPRKVFEPIGGKPMLSHVIDSCVSAAHYANRYSFKLKQVVSVAVLYPHKDEIGQAFRNHPVLFMEGPEMDVLSRYKALADKQGADYIVRVTGDCPLLPPFLLGKLITVATKNQLDYVSNVDEGLRTAADGFDVECMSKRALDWLDANSVEGPEREHVTLKLRQPGVPYDFRYGHLVGYLDQSNIKLSVDTEEDLERVRAHYERLKRAIQTAENLHGRESIHRF